MGAGCCVAGAGPPRRQSSPACRPTRIVQVGRACAHCGESTARGDSSSRTCGRRPRIASSAGAAGGYRGPAPVRCRARHRCGAPGERHGLAGRHAPRQGRGVAGPSRIGAVGWQGDRAKGWSERSRAELRPTGGPSRGNRSAPPGVPGVNIAPRIDTCPHAPRSARGRLQAVDARRPRERPSDARQSACIHERKRRSPRLRESGASHRRSTAAP
jgi:hypothetical protein